MVLPIVTALVSAAPALIGLFDSPDDRTVSKAVKVASDVAQEVTGKGGDGEALRALQEDPELLFEYQRQTAHRAIVLYQEETKRLQTVNETIRAEVASRDPYVRRMRPTMGYALILSWTLTMAAIVYTIVTDPAAASAVIVALADLSVMWSVALSVLGLYVYKRSEDKKPSTGPGTGIVGKIAGSFLSR